PESKTSLTVNWMDFGRIDLKKYGETSEDGNFMNPLEGAEFTLTDKATGDIATTMTTDASGAATSDWLPVGRTYTVAETKTPAGYKAVTSFDVTIGEKDKTYHYDLLDRIFSGEVKLIKYDANAEKPIFKAGTIFKVKDADGNYIKQRQKYPNDQLIDEFVTNDEGYLVMPEKLVSGNYSLEEVKAPAGYTLGKADIPFTVGPDTYKDGYVTVHYGDTPVTGTVKVIKKDNVTSQLLAGAEFTLTAAEDIVSPADGSMRYEKGAVVATQITGENGEALFDNLYLGQYILKETKAPVNYYQDDTKEYPITIEYKDQDTPVIEINQDVENERGIIIGTQATDKNTGTQEAIPGKQTTFVDTVKYEKLAIGSEYTVKGILMDKATGQPLLINGEKVTAETTFTPEKSDGTVDVIFTFDASSLKGKEIVVFEDLFQDKDKIYTHADIKDKDQTIKFTESKIKTTAKDKASGKNEGTVNPTTTIVDTVQYTDLIVGQEYTMKGVLMDKSTGNPLIVNGQEIRVEKTFKPEKKDGTVELEFTFDSSALVGKEVVVFESLYQKDTEVAVHADINDIGQTVKFIALPTTPATGLTGNNTMILVVALLIIAVASGTAYYFVKMKKNKED
ncbi:MAG: VaFE repeat-containing surface-anchored protein, partial [Eubacterium sp.]